MSHTHVVLVVSLNSVLQEEGSAHDVVYHCVLHCDVMGAVNVDGSVEGIVDGNTLHIRAFHVSVQVEMDWVTSQSVIARNVIRVKLVH